MIKREGARIYGLVFLKPYWSGSLLPPFSLNLAMHTFVLFFIYLSLSMLNVRIALDLFSSLVEKPFLLS
jgi:hypothetical protein